ncbi:tetratricopeptide repeat protein [Chryseobacterium sp. WG14]|uniref:tetratricopeptide repeat protein n=1 Tax=unclassified Chryseobacterium TaxID=2593645 RepID=UPI00211E44CE|nr:MULTISPECIES: tetratricopeptide repeat protein [unclassified Chryseobacterium]MCQ9636705.1 tetratricopeptide repeat protein [Chryseobacterium sp. WG23]MCQ9640926.1 tetratricopeptide repeat protein [Chryseobacterium sp. WG14]
MMIRSLLFVLLIILFSCNQYSREQDQKKFDISLWEKNELFRLSGDYDSLVSLNTEYYRKANKMGYEEGKSLCYINMAELNMTLGNYQKARVLFDHTDGILKDSKDYIHKARFYNVYSRFNSMLKKLDKAFEYNNAAMGFIYKSKNSALKNDILFNIYFRQGEYYIQKKKYEKALEYFQKAKKLDASGFADAMISDYIYMYKNSDSAYTHIFRAYTAIEKRGRKDVIALYVTTVFGEYYLSDKQYDKAEEMFLQALKINKKIRNVYANYTRFIYNDLRRVYEQKGDKERAYIYLRAYADANNKINTAVLKTINQDMESFISETKKDTESHDKGIQWVILLSVIGFSVLGIYAWRIIDLLRKKKEALTTETEKLKARVDGSKQDEILELARKNDPEFFNRFKETYPKFVNRLLSINPNLETSELTFCAMIKLHFTSKEIAAYTLIQHRTVQQKKYRIRKRLHIPTETDIYHFFDELG